MLLNTSCLGWRKATVYFVQVILLKTKHKQDTEFQLLFNKVQRAYSHAELVLAIGKDHLACPVLYLPIARLEVFNKNSDITVLSACHFFKLVKNCLLNTMNSPPHTALSSTKHTSS